MKIIDPNGLVRLPGIVNGFRFNNFLDRKMALDASNAFPTFPYISDNGVEYKYSWQKGKAALMDYTKIPWQFQQILGICLSDAFVHELEQITGIDNLKADSDLVGGGLHSMLPGSRLDLHIDFCRHKTKRWFRRLNLILFFNARWDKSWGGETEFWDLDKGVELGLVRPQFNSGVLFETTDVSFHGVRKVKSPLGISRHTMAFYYYTEDPPPWYKGVDHATVFRTRPNEFMRRNFYIPAEKLGIRVREKAVSWIERRLNISK